ncbi:MAG: CHAP domain-containing protein, partial [Myxococcales bacterium]
RGDPYDESPPAACRRHGREGDEQASARAPATIVMMDLLRRETIRAVRALRPVGLALVLLLCACAAPQQGIRPRDPLLDPPPAQLTPEARPATIPRARDPIFKPEPTGLDGEAIARTAAGYIGEQTIVSGGRRYPDDCTGFVRAVYAAHGVELFTDDAQPGDNGVTAIWRFASKNGRVRTRQARVGDIVFFKETYDRNRDGRRNDGLTHVGIVDGIEPDGTVTVVHRVARGVVRYRMNLERPKERKDEKTGRVLNDYLRERGRSRLAGELFAGFATIGK